MNIIPHGVRRFSTTVHAGCSSHRFFADHLLPIVLGYSFGLTLLFTTFAPVQSAQSSTAGQARSPLPIASPTPSATGTKEVGGSQAALPRSSTTAPSDQPEPAPSARATAPESFSYSVLKQALGTAVGSLLSLFLLIKFVHAHQRENERQKLLHELAKEFSNITSTRCVTKLKENGLDANIKYRFTIALTRQVPWAEPSTLRHDFSTSDRLVYFAAEQEGLVSASILHEVLFWFRRMHRARQVKLLRDVDLHQMWRQVLPFVTDGRYTFLKRYFGDETKNKEDILAILEVAKSVLRHCKKKRLTLPIAYLADRPSGVSRVDRAFLADISTDLSLFICKETQTGIARNDSKPGP